MRCEILATTDHKHLGLVIEVPEVGARLIFQDVTFNAPEADPPGDILPGDILPGDIRPGRGGLERADLADSVDLGCGKIKPLPLVGRVTLAAIATAADASRLDRVLREDQRARLPSVEVSFLVTQLLYIRPGEVRIVSPNYIVDALVMEP